MKKTQGVTCSLAKEFDDAVGYRGVFGARESGCVDGVLVKILFFYVFFKIPKR